MGEDRAPSTVGSGENSYALNSTIQRNTYEKVKKVLEDAIRSNLPLSIRNDDVIRAADLGCAVGPNTFFTVQTIIDAVLATMQGWSSHHGPDPEFQVFFNDQIDNDFNVLFSNLPPKRRYFAAGVPGSFYSRLFPRDSIHFFHSTLALHWLSRPPQGVTNKGRIDYYGGGPEIENGYLAQFRADMGAFLALRAEELKEGGLMSILILCRDESKEHTPPGQRFYFCVLETILQQLLPEGKVKEEDVDAFQLPFYAPTIAEFMEVVKVNGRFSVRVAQVDEEGWKIQDGGVLDGSKGSLEQCSRFLTASCRSVMEQLLQRQFGEKIAEEIFQRVPQQVEHDLIRLGSMPAAPVALFILQLKPSASA